VTKYQEDELYAAGRFTMQSQVEKGGVRDMADRRDGVTETDLVLWSVFGLTHNPRVEDWPVMPVEVFQVHFTPADFFERNPAIDVPGERNRASVLVDGEGGKCC
jgi:primary-amine oxidase